MSDKNFKISVIILNYNSAKWLELCLGYLREQSFTDFEVIVVDNNSKEKLILPKNTSLNLKLIESKENMQLK